MKALRRVRLDREIGVDSRELYPACAITKERIVIQLQGIVALAPSPNDVGAMTADLERKRRFVQEAKAALNHHAKR